MTNMHTCLSGLKEIVFQDKCNMWSRFDTSSKFDFVDLQGLYNVLSNLQYIIALAFKTQC